jgi:bifunctional non-homologous end joining protein LigD
MALEEYAEKRDFRKTAEPSGKKSRRKPKGNRFVIQKHAATRLHYDFRLEFDGTLKSWAVPKGIPLKKGEKRLAIQVEDHPLDYADFEGTIPKGQYGGGTVMVWDCGTFEIVPTNPPKNLEMGQLHFLLHGKKLEGEWSLIRLKGEENQWLLIKNGDDAAPISVELDDTSALSGRRMQEISHGDQVWESHRPAKKSKSIPLPTFVPPMLAKPVTDPPTGSSWTFEIKFDGYRAIALKGGAHANLLSRNEKTLADKFPAVARAIAELSVDQAVIDGEIVALDSDGRSSFQLLQSYEIGETRPPLFYYAFDLLLLNGVDCRDNPLTERKGALAKLLEGAPDIIRFSASLTGDIKVLMAKARELGLEGLVGKKSNAVYESGRRTGAWVKIKLTNQQEFVIGGFTLPEGGRQYFGAILVGYYQDGELRFAGKVGSGFTDQSLRSLYRRFQELATDNCPFAGLPEKKESRWGQALTPAEIKRCRWVRPELVAQVRFTEWTRDDKLRHGVFLGLRNDKTPTEVQRS